MWSRIKQTLVSRPVKAMTGFLGASSEVLDAAFFLGIYANKLLTDLFKPMGAFATAITGISTPSTLLSDEKSKIDKMMSVLSIGSTAAFFYAIFLAEAAAAPMIFAYVTGTGWGLETLELLLKKHYGETIPVEQMNAYVRNTFKKMSILGVLINQDAAGVGENLQAAKKGEVELFPKICAGIAGAVSGYNAASGLYKTQQHFFAVQPTAETAQTPGRDIEAGYGENDILGEAYHRIVNSN